MKNLYHDTRELDKIAVSEHCLTEDIMMENAATAMEKAIDIYISQNKALVFCTPIPVLIVCGGGNNGGDGYTLARRMAGNKKIKVLLWAPKQPKSPQCILQAERALKNSDIEVFTTLDKCSFNFDSPDLTVQNSLSHLIIVDCFIGSGFTGTMRKPSAKIITQLNKLHTAGAWTLACDVPSGLPADCTYSDTVVKADCTITMGARKTALYCECAKEFAGHIECANLGLQSTVFEGTKTVKKTINRSYEAKLLEPEDIKLPHRKNPNTHKGSFGHAAIFAGEKPGAAVIAGTTTSAFGAGLTTLIDASDTLEGVPNCPFTLMQSQMVLPNTTAECAGPGLGRDFEDDETHASQVAFWIFQHREISTVLDADIFYYPHLIDLLLSRSHANAQTVLTPHPKEFATILQLCNLANSEECTVPYIKNHSIELVQRFCTTFPGTALILKGSTQIIGYLHPATTTDSSDKISENLNKLVQIYLNPWGNNCLSKGGSGDVLAGLITALLAQKYTALEAALSGSLAITLAAKKGLESGIIKSDYSMSPFDLIEAVKEL